jgi:hypothetical protein
MILDKPQDASGPESSATTGQQSFSTVSGPAGVTVSRTTTREEDCRRTGSLTRVKLFVCSDFRRGFRRDNRNQGTLTGFRFLEQHEDGSKDRQG